MFDVIIANFLAQAPLLIVSMAVLAASFVSVFFISIKVNVYELKQQFDFKRFLNGLAEIVFAILSVFLYAFSAVGFIQVIEMSQLLKEGLADQASVAALLGIFGVAIYKNILKYQAKAKEKLEVTEQEIADAYENPASVSGDLDPETVSEPVGENG